MAEEELAAMTWQERAVKRVIDDYERGEEFLRPFHSECLDRYEHYRSSQLGPNIKAHYVDNKFPVPFTTEQVNTLVARAREKLFYKNRPCSIYGREKTDEKDAMAKRELFDYQDRKDEIESKNSKAMTWAAIAGICPAQITFKKVTNTEVVNSQMPITDDAGQPIFGADGMPLAIDIPKVVEIPSYMGATVELIDLFDFFFTPEKTEIDDDEPFIIRSRRKPRWFYTKDYFFNQDLIKMKDKDGGGDTADVQNIIERRRLAGLEVDEKYFGGHCIYLEWQGYYEPGKDAVDGDGGKYPAGHYVIGVVTGTAWEDTLVRFDYRPLPIDRPNIIVGCLMEEFGEIMGPRFVDNFHAVQHAQDSIMGMWFANLKQLVKRPKVVNSDALKNPDQINTNVDEVIEVEERPDVKTAIYYPDVPPLSPDLYNGLSMLRTMGQNASKVRDQAEGIAQEGVETLGEARILAGETQTGINDYIRAWERTFILPMYEIRNAINSYYLNQEYVISVVGEKGLDWRTVTPAQIRAEVDFVCEASSRETERGVIAQQIIQTIQPMMNLMTLYANMGYPPQLWPRVDIMLEMLYDQWTWQSDKIQKILPSTTLDDAEEEQLAQQLQMYAQLKMMMGQDATQGSTSGKQPDSARTPQPRNEGEAQRSANDRNTTKVGRMQ